jgi:hypothetical protein
MMKSVLDDLRLEPRPNMWQEFDIVGIVHKELFSHGQTVMEKFYCDFLKRFTEHIRRKRPYKWRNNSSALYHDKPAAHASLVVRQFLVSTNTTVIPKTPYSPDRAPCNFFLFRKMKLKLKGRRFDSIEEIQTDS